MKIQVLYDKQGKLISAAFPMPPRVDLQAPRSGVEPKDDQHVAEFDVPEELTKIKPAELASRLHELLQVDTKSKPHKLVFKSK